MIVVSFPCNETSGSEMVYNGITATSTGLAMGQGRYLDVGQCIIIPITLPPIFTIGFEVEVASSNAIILTTEFLEISYNEVIHGDGSLTFDNNNTSFYFHYTYDFESTTQQVYINDSLVKYNASIDAIQDTIPNIVFGNSSFSGTIKNICIYDTALMTGEVESIVNKTDPLLLLPLGKIYGSQIKNSTNIVASTLTCKNIYHVNFKNIGEEDAVLLKLNNVDNVFQTINYENAVLTLGNMVLSTNSFTPYIDTDGLHVSSITMSDSIYMAATSTRFSIFKNNIEIFFIQK
jgi:hypothetical protein